MISLCLVVTSDFPWLTCLSPHSPDLLLCLILRCNLDFSPTEETHLKAPRRPVLHIRKQWKHLLSFSLFLLPGFLFVCFLFICLFLFCFAIILDFLFCLVWFCFFAVEQGRTRTVLGVGRQCTAGKPDYTGAMATWESVELPQGKRQKSTSGSHPNLCYRNH